MLVHVQVALARDVQVHHSVSANLLKHMVEEPQSGVNLAFSRAVHVYLYGNVGLLGHATNLCPTLARKQQFRNLVPRHSVLAQYQSLAAQVGSQLRVGLSIANHVRSRNIIHRVVHVFLQHSRTRLAHGRVVLGEMSVYMLGAEHNALALQSLHNKVVYGIEVRLREGVCTQTVLIAYHHQLKVGMLLYKREVLYHVLNKFQFLKRVYLLVVGFFHNCAITVYKQKSLLFCFFHISLF